MCSININGKWETHLFVQPKDTLKEIWEGRRPGVEGAVENWPVDYAHSVDELQAKLADFIAQSSKIMHRMGIMPEVDELVVKAIKKLRARQRYGTGPISIEDPSNLIAEMRLIKSDSEIAQMKFASDNPSLAHIAAMKHGGGNNAKENQLQSLIEGFLGMQELQDGHIHLLLVVEKMQIILYYKQNEDYCKDGDVVLIDAGAEFRGYAADITRSWPNNGQFTDAQKEIYQIVLDAQIAAIDECVVGNPYNAPFMKQLEKY